MMEVVVTTGAISRAKPQSHHHHQQTNTQLFTGQMLFLSPKQQCQSTEGKTVFMFTRVQQINIAQLSINNVRKQAWRPTLK